MNRRSVLALTAHAAALTAIPKGGAIANDGDPALSLPFRVRCDSDEVSAGEGFKLKVELSKKAPVNLRVTFEKQRVIPHSLGGAPEVRPTGGDYFAEGKFPQSISIKAGTQSAFSEEIVVRKDAKAEQGEPRLQFPEALLIVAYLAGAAPGSEASYSLIMHIL
jgi:hypothetical protein